MFNPIRYAMRSELEEVKRDIFNEKSSKSSSFLYFFYPFLWYNLIVILLLVRLRMIYGYVRISTKKQNIARQVSNILKIYPNAKIFQEIFTGTTSSRPEWDKLKRIVEAGELLMRVKIK